MRVFPTLFFSVNLALNHLNRDSVFDGKMSTSRSILDATVNLDGHFIIEAIQIHTGKNMMHFVKLR